MAIIDKPSDYFNTVLYTGNGGTQSITGLDFAPNWVWIKDRGDTGYHQLVDTVRGATKYLSSNADNAEGTEAAGLTSFNSDGFSLGNNTNYNSGDPRTYVSWNWKAGGTASSNTDGSITSSVSANTDAGFSIVSYTGTGANATVGHGLGVAPSMILFKNYSRATNWLVYNKNLGATKFLYLNVTDAEGTDSGHFNDTEPTSTVFSVGTANGTNYSGENLIAYCFAEKQGYSKFGSYTGNGNADGTFVYLGFKPAFCILKRTDAAYSWATYDAKRYPENKSSIPALWSNENSAEGSYSTIDFLSNGLKIRDTSATINESGGSYIYMAFAENPFVTSTAIPACAR
jgi:hypothetical protein